ncbi:MAG: hypothetical protein ACRYF5_03670 [Janthinobacterium lividum]
MRPVAPGNAKPLSAATPATSDAEQRARADHNSDAPEAKAPAELTSRPLATGEDDPPSTRFEDLPNELMKKIANIPTSKNLGNRLVTRINLSRTSKRFLGMHAKSKMQNQLLEKALDTTVKKHKMKRERQQQRLEKICISRVRVHNAMRRSSARR